jgi:hypothetical protein
MYENRRAQRAQKDSKNKKFAVERKILHFTGKK